MDQITICNVGGVAHSDKPTENYHLALQFPSAPWSFSASFSSLFWFSGPQLCSRQSRFQPQQAAVFSGKSSDKPAVRYVPST